MLLCTTTIITLSVEGRKKVSRMHTRRSAAGRPWPGIGARAWRARWARPTAGRGRWTGSPGPRRVARGRRRRRSSRPWSRGPPRRTPRRGSPSMNRSRRRRRNSAAVDCVVDVRSTAPGHEAASKGSPYSSAERRAPEVIPILGSQPAGDVSHKPAAIAFRQACSYPRNP